MRRDASNSAYEGAKAWPKVASTMSQPDHKVSTRAPKRSDMVPAGSEMKRAATPVVAEPGRFHAAQLEAVGVRRKEGSDRRLE